MVAGVKNKLMSLVVVGMGAREFSARVSLRRENKYIIFFIKLLRNKTQNSLIIQLGKLQSATNYPRPHNRNLIKS